MSDVTAGPNDSKRWLDTDFERGRHQRRIDKIETDNDATELFGDAK